MTEPVPARTSRVGAKRALLLLLAINLFNYLDRTVLNALSQPIRGYYQLSEEKFGYLTTVFLYAYMVGAPMLGMLAVRMSRWWLIAGSVTIWSLASGFTGLASGFTMLLIARILVGVGEAGYGPAAPALISDYFPPERRGRVMALFYLAIPVGSALGYIYGGQIFAWFGSWKLAFWLVVPPGLALAVLCLFMRDPGKFVTDEKKEAEPRPSFFQEVKTLFRIPSFLANTIAMTAMTFVIGGMSVWVPEYFTLRMLNQEGLAPFLALEPQTSFYQLAARRRDVLVGEVNFTFGLIVVGAGIFSTFLGGWVSDKLRGRIRGAYLAVSGAAILLAFPCILAMIWLDFPWAWWAVGGAVFFLFFNTGPANTALANVTTSPMRATAFAVNIFIIHALGDAISPPLIGWLARSMTWNDAFLLVSPLVLVASAVWFIGARYLADDEQRAKEMGPPVTP
jgi:MFS transporter, Spinster family, sphingosine-1-phosphate transporter